MGAIYIFALPEIRKVYAANIIPWMVIGGYLLFEKIFGNFFYRVWCENFFSKIMVLLRLVHGYVITPIALCGIYLLIHALTSMALTLGHGWIFHPTLFHGCCYLSHLCNHMVNSPTSFNLKKRNAVVGDSEFHSIWWYGGSICEFNPTERCWHAQFPFASEVELNQHGLNTVWAWYPYFCCVQ